jgi:hypothetical protein
MIFEPFSDILQHRILGSINSTASIAERVMPSLVAVLGPAVCHEVRISVSFNALNIYYI